MAKSLNEHRKNIKPEVRTAARAKAMDIVMEMSSAGTKKTKGKHNTLISKTHRAYQYDKDKIIR